MTIIKMNDREKLPDFVDVADGYKNAEPVVVRPQGAFVAVIQRDGAGEDIHWVLIEKDDVEDFIEKVREAAKEAK